MCAAFLLARSLRAYPVVRGGCLPQPVKFGRKVRGVHREVCHIYAFLKVLTLLTGGIRTACTIDKSNCHYNGKEKPQYVFHASRCKVFYHDKSTNIFLYVKHRVQECGKKSVLVPCGDVNHAIYVRKTGHWHKEIKIKSLTLLRKAMSAHMTGACV